jgi:acetoin:2,6-dichlorophenolindophenol oxidoreductase subunit alpha
MADATLWRLFETMLLMRRFEEAVALLSQQKAFTGHYHLYIGQEATGAAVMSALRAEDHVATTHRNHGHVVARGADPGAGLAEIIGRSTGLNGGRGGTIHLTDPSLGFLSTSGVVGGAISLGVGGGYACKQRGDGSLCAIFFGDGALEEGIAFEALNIASLWQLPVLFVCENNSKDAWGKERGGFPSLVHAAGDLRSIPGAVGIPTQRVDGADAMAMHAATVQAVESIRAGGGPVFIEAVTRRWAGSAPLWPELSTGVTDLRMASGEVAMPAGEHHAWYETHDPVLAAARVLLAEGGDAAARLREIDRVASARIEAARRFAVDSAAPAAADATLHVFA